MTKPPTANDLRVLRRLRDSGWLRTYRPMHRALTAILPRYAELEEANRWVPVSERLPRVGKGVCREVIVCLNNGAVATVFWQHGDTLEKIPAATHWRYMPVPPVGVVSDV